MGRVGGSADFAQTVAALRAEGVYMEESECPVCMYTFTEIMSHEKQREAGISMEQFRELNKKESDDHHCWRNIVIPCMHAKVDMFSILNNG